MPFYDVCNMMVSTSLSIGSASGSSNLHINGSLGHNVISVSSNATISGNASYLLAGNSIGPIQLKLPDPSLCPGRIYWVKKTNSSQAVTLTSPGNTIDHSTEVVLSSNSMGSVQVIANGNSWLVLSSNHAEKALFSSNLFLWLPLEEGSGSVVSDVSGNGYSGTLENFETSGNGWTTGRSGSGLSFDGANDHISMSPSDAFMPSLHMTISLWIKPLRLYSVTGAAEAYLSKAHSSAPWKSYSILMISGDVFQFAWVDDSSTDHTTIFGDVAVANQWYHLVVTVSDSIRLYLDGYEKNTVGIGTGTIFTSDSPLRIGRSGASYGHSVMDDFRMYDYALSASEVLQLHLNGSQ